MADDRSEPTTLEQEIAMANWLRILSCWLLVSASGAAYGEPPPVRDTDGLDDLLAVGKKGDDKPVREKTPSTKDDLDDLLKVVRDKSAKGADKSDPPDSAPPPPKKPAADSSAKYSLPRYYDKLGLTDEQKEQIGRISKDYDPRIAELKSKLERIARVRAPGFISIQLSLITATKRLIRDRDKAFADVLTPDQRNTLRELMQADKK
jgi:hypothetical protein